MLLLQTEHTDYASVSAVSLPCMHACLRACVREEVFVFVCERIYGHSGMCFGRKLSVDHRPSSVLDVYSYSKLLIINIYFDSLDR